MHVRESCLLVLSSMTPTSFVRSSVSASRSSRHTQWSLSAYNGNADSCLSIVTSAKTHVTRSGRFVCQSVCVNDYYKSNQPISLIPSVMIGTTNRKNCSTFGSDPVPVADSGSHFHFPHHCGIAGFRRFLRISHSHRPIFTNSAKWLTPTR